MRKQFAATDAYSGSQAILFFYHVPTHVEVLNCACLNIPVYNLVYSPNTLVLQDNDYVSAIKSVATILADYDSDQMFPAFGFGARAPQFGGVSHCFPLNFNFEQPEVRGVQVIYE